MDNKTKAYKKADVGIKSFIKGVLVGGLAAIVLILLGNLFTPTRATERETETTTVEVAEDIVIEAVSSEDDDTETTSSVTSITEPAILTGIEFASPSVYEGKDVTDDGLTVTAIFSDGTREELTDYVLYSVVAQHEGTIAEVKTTYGTFEWEVPVIAISSILAEYEDAVYAGREVSVKELDFIVEYEDGTQTTAKYSMLDLPSGTVILGAGNTIAVGYNGVEYIVELP